MKNLYLFLLILCTTSPLFAQITELESLPIPLLKQKLVESTNDTSKIQYQLALGRALLLRAETGDKTIDTAQTLATQAIKLSRQLNYHEGIINAMLVTAIGLNRNNKTDLGLKTAQQALAYAQKVKSIGGEAESYIIIGQQYTVNTKSDVLARAEYYDKAITLLRTQKASRRLASVLEQYAELLLLARQKNEAIKVLFEALNINKAVGYKGVQVIYQLIGRTSLEFADFPNAVKYHLLAIKTAKEVKDSSLVLCGIYNSLANTYVNMNDFERAIPYSLLALQIAKRHNHVSDMGTVSMMLSSEYALTHKINQSLAILDEVKKTADDDRDMLMVMSSYLINLVHAKEYKKAAPYAKEVVNLSEKMQPGDAVLAPAYHYLAQYYVLTQQVPQAYKYVDLYAGIVNKARQPKAIRITEMYYYKLDSLRGNYKSAVNHYLKAQRIKDSIDNVTKTYQISLLHIENETEKKNNDIDALKKQTIVKDVQLKRNQLIQKVIIGGTVLLAIITALIYSRYRLKIRNNALLTKQKAAIDQQNIELQGLINDKNGLINDKDELLHEKDLLLKEVNHRVKNNLQIVMSLLQSQSGYMQNEKAQQAILESQNRVRSIALIHDQLYNTDKVAEISLPSYITELICSLDDSLNNIDHKITISHEIDNIALDVSQAIPLGIILNESVTNALKYAFPDGREGTITVKIEQHDQEIRMQVSDNGAGIPPDFDLIKANSLGMTLIQGLTSQLKGTLTIEANSGLTITVKFEKEITGISGNQAKLTETT